MNSPTRVNPYASPTEIVDRPSRQARKYRSFTIDWTFKDNLLQAVGIMLCALFGWGFSFLNLSGGIIQFILVGAVCGLLWRVTIITPNRPIS